MVARLAWRSIWRHRRRTVITVASIGFGLACVVFFVALNEGVYEQLVDDAVRMQAGHITVEHPAFRDAPAVDLRVSDVMAVRTAIQGLPEVERVKLLVLGQGVARSGQGAVGVAVMGVEPSAEAHSSPLAEKIVAGAYLEDDDVSRVVVGRQLADQLDLEVGKKLVLATNDADGALVEALFRVGGVFETGASEIDGYVVQMPLASAQRLYGLGAGEATQIGVVLRDSAGVGEALARVRALAARAPVAVLPWQEVLPELAALIRLDRVSDRTFLGLLLVLILFTIFNTILMSVLERERELAVMLALGTSKRHVAGQVLAETAYIGVMGCVVGLVLGGALAWWVQVHGWDLSAVYENGVTVSGVPMATRLHTKLTAAMLGWLAAIVFGATMLLSIAPLRRATRVRVADVLR